MIYVVSNLHGNYAKFKELLKVISFKETDIMRGEETENKTVLKTKFILGSTTK